MRCLHCVGEMPSPFTWREIIGEARIVGSVVPPVPEYTHRKFCITHQVSSRLENHVGVSTIPDPDPCFTKPFRSGACMKPALSRPVLSRSPFAIALDGAEPVSVNNADNRSI